MPDSITTSKLEPCPWCAAMREALEKVEWLEDKGFRPEACRRCPLCNGMEEYGHNGKCAIAKALENMPDEKTTPKLESCPWCKYRDCKCDNVTIATSSIPTHWVECACCGASGPASFGSRIRAAREWNRVSRLVQERSDA